jgi:RNA polymerase sigma factor (sigma-70 family)
MTPRWAPEASSGHAWPPDRASHHQPRADLHGSAAFTSVPSLLWIRRRGHRAKSRRESGATSRPERGSAHEGRASLKSWLRTLAKNATIDFYRSRQSRYIREEFALPETMTLHDCGAAAYGNEQESALDALLRQEERYRVRRHIVRLKEEHQVVINYRWTDLDPAEVAERMGKTVAAVNMLFRRAIMRLTELVKNDPDLAEGDDEEVASYEPE